MPTVDINTVRKANLRRLVAEAGSTKDFADKVGTDPAYVSALLSDTIGRNPGDKFMRKVEEAHQLEPGTLDFPEEASMAAALAIQALPAEDREQTLDFIRYKIETAGALVANAPAAAEYLKLRRSRKPGAPPPLPRKRR